MTKKMVKIHLVNCIGMMVTIVVLIGGVIFIGGLLEAERGENKFLRLNKCVEVPAKVQGCLMLEFERPHFWEITMDGMIFEEGTCSEGSEAPYCNICGSDLSREGRRRLIEIGED